MCSLECGYGEGGGVYATLLSDTLELSLVTWLDMTMNMNPSGLFNSFANFLLISCSQDVKLRVDSGYIWGLPKVTP